MSTCLQRLPREMMAKKSIGIILILLALIILWQIISPARFLINILKRVDLSDPVATGEQLVMKYECRKCHRIGGEGALKAPDLKGVTKRLDEAILRQWLVNPRALERRTAMPNFRLSDGEITAIIAYLQKLDTQKP